jgi:hypothetical protein
MADDCVHCGTPGAFHDPLTLVPIDGAIVHERCLLAYTSKDPLQQAMWACKEQIRAFASREVAEHNRALVVNELLEFIKKTIYEELELPLPPDMQQGYL